MTRVFEDETFEHFYEDGCAATYGDMVFRRCYFRSCAVSITKDPRLRTMIRNSAFLGCRCGPVVGPQCAVVEEVLVENLRTEDVLQTWGAVFKHVVLRGRIDDIMISNRIFPAEDATPDRIRAFEEANAAYYATVDWALDISQADFKDCDIRGIPARLIRRDPETQVVVTREKAMRGIHRDLDLGGADWAGLIDLSLKDGEPDVVLVAPKRHRNFKKLVRALPILREAGVAEPD